MKIPNTLNSFDPNLPSKTRSRRHHHNPGGHPMHYTRTVPDNSVLGNTLMPGVNSLTLSGRPNGAGYYYHTPGNDLAPHNLSGTNIFPLKSRNGNVKDNMAKRNERERNRVKMVNMAFDKLRQRIPWAESNPKMSKVDTLRAALEYIKCMQTIIQECDIQLENQQHRGAISTLKHESIHDFAIFDNGDTYTKPTRVSLMDPISPSSNKHYFSPNVPFGVEIGHISNVSHNFHENRDRNSGTILGQSSCNMNEEASETSDQGADSRFPGREANSANLSTRYNFNNQNMASSASINKL